MNQLNETMDYPNFSLLLFRYESTQFYQINALSIVKLACERNAVVVVSVAVSVESQLDANNRMLNVSSRLGHITLCVHSENGLNSSTGHIRSGLEHA